MAPPKGSHLAPVNAEWEDSYRTEGDKPLDAATLADQLGTGNYSGYDEDHFYLRAVDHHGHIGNTQVTYPANFNGLFARIIESPLFPYETKTMAARNYLVHGMVRDLQKIEAHAGEPIDDAWFQSIEADRQRTEIEEQERYITETFPQAADAAARVGNWEVLRRVLTAASAMHLPERLAKKRDEKVQELLRHLPHDEQD